MASEFVVLMQRNGTDVLAHPEQLANLSSDTHTLDDAVQQLSSDGWRLFRDETKGTERTVVLSRTRTLGACA